MRRGGPGSDVEAGEHLSDVSRGAGGDTKAFISTTLAKICTRQMRFIERKAESLCVTGGHKTRLTMYP